MHGGSSSSTAPKQGTKHPLDDSSKLSPVKPRPKAKAKTEKRDSGHEPEHTGHEADYTKSKAYSKTKEKKKTTRYHPQKRYIRKTQNQK